MLDIVASIRSISHTNSQHERTRNPMLNKKYILEIQERILVRIAAMLNAVYHEPTQDLSVDNISAKLAFKGDPHLNELRLALERINRGEYGQCIFCKDDISMEILRELPTAHFCKNCATTLIKKNASAEVHEPLENN